MSLRQLIGPSGSGLTRELTRLYRETPGAVMLTADPRSHLTYLRETVAEELAFGMEQRGVPVAEMQDRIGEISRALDLGELLERPPHQLSGGQTRRLAIAAVLILETPLILLDDPFSGLDTSSRARLQALLHNLAAEVVVAGHRDCLPGIPTSYLGELAGEMELPAAVAPAAGYLDCAGVVGHRGVDKRRWWQFRRDERAQFRVGPVDLRVPRGGVLWLRGANGSGKTTLLRALAGLDGAPAPGQRTGLLLQDPVDQILDAEVARMVPDRALRELFALDPQAHPLDLSQRGLRLAQFASVLSGKPELLLADEPDVGLDVAGRQLFHQGLAGYLRSGGAVVLTCHDESFLAEVAGYSGVREQQL